MLSGDIIRGYSDALILRILIEKDSYGYEIAKEMETRSGGSFSMKETTLYSAIARMEKRGLISSYYGTETFGRRRTYYSVTPQGAQYYNGKCAEWGETKEIINRFLIEPAKEELHG